MNEVLAQEAETHGVDLEKRALADEITRYAVFALSDDAAKQGMSTMYTNVGASNKQLTLSQFWCTSPKVREFPLLAKLARKIVSIPMTQIDCERLFSFFGDLTRGKRNRTSTDWLYKSALARFNCPWEELLRDVFPNAAQAPVDSGALHVDAERIARAQHVRATNLHVRRDLADAMNAAAGEETDADVAPEERAGDSVSNDERAPLDSTADCAPAASDVAVAQTGDGVALDAALEAAVAAALETALAAETTNDAASPSPAGGVRRKSALDVPGSARKDESEAPAAVVRRSTRSTAGLPARRSP